MQASLDARTNRGNKRKKQGKHSKQDPNEKSGVKGVGVQRGGSTNRCGIQIYLLQPAVVVELELSCNAVGASWAGKLS